MTHLTRRLLDTRHGRVAARSPAPVASPVADLPMRVEIRLPDFLPTASAEELKDALQGRLSALLAELRLDRTFTITIGSAGPGATGTTVSIGGRPVAQLRSDPARPAAAAGPLLDDVLSRILRRLSLLGGPGINPRSTYAYLLALGCRVPVGASADAFDVDAAERLIDGRSDEHILLEVAASTMRRVEGTEAGAVADLRETESRKRGVV